MVNVFEILPISNVTIVDHSTVYRLAFEININNSQQFCSVLLQALYTSYIFIPAFAWIMCPVMFSFWFYLILKWLMTWNYSKTLLYSSENRNCYTALSVMSFLRFSSTIKNHFHTNKQTKNGLLQANIDRAFEISLLLNYEK